MKTIICIYCFLISFSVSGQDTIFYDDEMNRVNTFEEAGFYEIKLTDALDTSFASEVVYFSH